MPLLSSIGGGAPLGFGLRSLGEEFWIAKYDAGSYIIPRYLRLRGNGVLNFVTENGSAQAEAFVVADNGTAINIAKTISPAFSMGFQGSLDSSGNLYTAVPYNSTFGIAKLDASLVLQWQKGVYSGPVAAAESSGVSYYSDSLIYLTGKAYSNTSPYPTIPAVGCVDSSGNWNWVAALDQGSTGGAGYARYSAVDSSGNVFVAGYNNAAKGFLAKFNSSGTASWVRTLMDGANYFDCTGVAVDSSGDVYVVGKSNAGTTSWLVKFSTLGALQWQRALSVSGISGISIDAADNIYVSTLNAGVECGIAKWNSTGTLQWQRKFGPYFSSSPSNVIVNAVGAFYVAAWDINTPQMCLWKLPVDGGKVGTYDGLTYSASTYSEAAGSLTIATISPTSSLLTRTTKDPSNSMSTQTPPTVTKTQIP